MPFHTCSLEEFFDGADQKCVGRGRPGRISFDQLGVAPNHAIFYREGGELFVAPADPFHPVYVDDVLVHGPYLVREHARVGLGPYLVWFDAGTVYALDNSDGIDLEIHGLTFRNGERVILDHVSFKANRRQFVCILGTSGSGKSSLMKCLLRRVPIACGKVSANEQDYLKNFATFRPMLGYIPQYDILHRELSVGDSLRYAARLRGVRVSRLKLDEQIETTLSDTRLVEKKDELKRLMSQTLQSLSGGQVRRISLSSELMLAPRLLLADEATSGLDPATDLDIMQLFRELADAGATILCITHNVENIPLCDKVIVLHKGCCLFEGTPNAALCRFGVNSFTELYKKVQSGHVPVAAIPVVVAAAPPNAIAMHPPAIVKVQPPFAALAYAKVPAIPRSKFQFWFNRTRAAALINARQLGLLSMRYAVLTLGGWKNSLRLPVILGALLAIGFCGTDFHATVMFTRKATPEEKELAGLAMMVIAKIMIPELANTYLQHLRDDRAVIPGGEIVSPTMTFMLMYIICIAILWFGCSTAAREVVKEREVLAQERLGGVGVVPYLSSKLAILWLLTLVQTALFLGTLYGILWLWGRTLPNTYALSFVGQFAVLAVMSFSGISWGLLISCSAKDQDKAVTISTYFLVAQLMLGGGVISTTGTILQWVGMIASPPFWAYRALARGATKLPVDFPGYQHIHDAVSLNCLALAAQAIIVFALAAYLLQRSEHTKQ